MTRFLSSWLILTISAGAMVFLLPESAMSAVGSPKILGVAAFALFMALINASIKPLARLLALPFTILSLGLVALIINWLCMSLASWLSISFFGVGVLVHGFLWSVIGSIIMSVVGAIITAIIGE
ncbi:hypothetical protein CRD60_00190 [Bifidobacterium aemilianum]|uniref:Phage holin family protein n=1 Tax=Bifidobacterium aemilianum TaxID=2493120 RepID=A0A366KCF3_9BIFI|nr:phage holin family protein [Bifidobacterium aemilianum]RBP98341.1 hypothetical protein CRD60_00190 [Bifidobacterium aemilianum]